MPASIPYDDGSRIAWVVTGSAITAGAFRLINNLVCRALTSGAVGETVTMVVAGRQDSVPTDTGTAWQVGHVLYWDNTNFRFTRTVGSNTKSAYCAADKASAATTASIILQQQG